MTDERKGKPSASGYERLYNCPGSLNAERGLPDTTSDEAESGTRIHAILETIARSEYQGGPLPVDCDEDELDKAWMLWHRGQAAMRTWLGDAECDSVHIEERLWIGDDDFSGKADLIFVAGNRALILDYKSGWGDHERNEASPQLRALTVLVLFKQPNVFDVQAEIVQLGRDFPPVVYDFDAAQVAAKELGDSLAAAISPDAPRNAGKWCTYCKARFTCEKSTAEIVTVAESQMEISNERWELLPRARKLELAKACKLAVKLAGDINKRIKEDLEADPNSIPGLTIKPGANEREIADTLAAWEKLGGILSVDQFTSAMKASVPKLEDAYYRKRKADDSKITKMTAGNEFAEILSGIIGTKQKEGSVSIL